MTKSIAMKQIGLWTAGATFSVGIFMWLLITLNTSMGQWPMTEGNIDAFIAITGTEALVLIITAGLVRKTMLCLAVLIER